MDPTQPIIDLTPQTLTATALDGAPATLVDDPVALVDDPTALVGNQTTSIKSIRVAIKPNSPRTDIPIRQ